jgi:beta-lactamase regulating signal transducer with metallopeptidase domain
MMTPMVAAVLDHLWQSTVFALAVGALTLLVRQNGAHVRYGLWLAASLKFLVPFSWLASATDMVAPTAIAVAPTLDPVINTVQPFAQPFATSAPVQAASIYVGPSVPLVLFGLWALGLAAVVTFRFARWKQIEEALWLAKPITMAADVPVKTTPYFMEPGLVGIRRPALLLPEDIIERLSPDELGAIVAHEQAHLRRRDNFTAMLHMAVETLFWFYPPVWWIGTRLIEERERACDESVLASGNSAEIYAESILKVCRLYVQSPLASVSGVSGADLKKRVEAIMSGRLVRRLGVAKVMVLGLASATAIAAPLAAGVMIPRNFGESAGAASPAEIALRLEEQRRPRTAVSIDPTVIENYTGFYHLKANTIVTVRRIGGRLISSITGGPSVDLLPESETKFFAVGLPAQVTFITDLQGRATELVLHQHGLDRRAKRIESDLEPGTNTEAWLRRYLAGMQRGEPNYDEMLPPVAAQARQRLPDMALRFQKWGPLQTVVFKNTDRLGGDVYTATFERAQVEWTVSPLTPDGKISYGGFQEVTAANTDQRFGAMR